jgi:hypothetical protein
MAVSKQSTVRKSDPDPFNHGKRMLVLFGNPSLSCKERKLMTLETEIGNIAHAIQLAIAPVFLLTGLAALLGVMANRLARVIDRARSIEATWPSLDTDAWSAARLEMRSLERRRNMCSWSINFCTLAALLVCLVIVTSFIEELFTINIRWLAGCLFVAAIGARDLRAHLVPARGVPRDTYDNN